MLTPYSVFGIGDCDRSFVMLGAYDTPVTVEIGYIGLKTPPQLPPPPITVHNVVTIPANTSQVVNIAMADPAFAGGYGAVQLRSVDPANPGTPSLVPFFAYAGMPTGPELHPVSGPAYVASRFRMPLMMGLRVKMVITNVDAMPGDVFICQPGAAGNLATQTVDPGACWLWDSQGGWTIDFSRELEVATTGVRLVVTATVFTGTRLCHMYLPRFG
jgi:hypothetical protein